MAVTRYRRLSGAAGAVFLTASLAGCSGLGRTAVGPVEYGTRGAGHVVVQSPVVTGCHRLKQAGAVSVANGTLVDIIMYPTTDCSGSSSVYVATGTSDVIAPNSPPWRSYSIVH
ncbi:hypothetical protein ACIBCM_13300 [Streptomyces sp. NPDC051018]|uniref:hypothetical protein n=1 Tax=Streptomyces sp. NPDC051018 TaxID=3365639 RepID=UPI00379069C6